MEAENRPYVPWEMINSFMIDVFQKYGVPKEDAEICADVLLESDRRGIESHVSNPAIGTGSRTAPCFR